jgi:hypothetical protein
VKRGELNRWSHPRVQIYQWPSLHWHVKVRILAAWYWHRGRDVFKTVRQCPYCSTAEKFRMYTTSRLFPKGHCGAPTCQAEHQLARLERRAIGEANR